MKTVKTSTYNKKTLFQNKLNICQVYKTKHWFDRGMEVTCLNSNIPKNENGYSQV